MKIRLLTKQQKAIMECRQCIEENKFAFNEWRCWDKSMNDFEEYPSFDYKLIFKLMQFYQEINIKCKDVDNAVNFMLNMNAADDNSMCVALNTAYYYCANALIEWLENMVLMDF
jgi:hypothetical protein